MAYVFVINNFGDKNNNCLLH